MAVARCGYVAEVQHVVTATMWKIKLDHLRLSPLQTDKYITLKHFELRRTQTGFRNV